MGLFTLLFTVLFVVWAIMEAAFGDHNDRP